MINVLHVCSIKGRGGTGYMAGRIVRLLHEGGNRVLVASCAGSKIEERARDAGLELLYGLKLRRGFRPFALYNDVMLIRKWIKQYGVEIVHAWHSIEYWTCALAVLGTGAKLARTRGLVTPIKPHFFNKVIHRMTAPLLVTCNKIRKVYEDAGLPTDNIRNLNDGVDTTRFKPDNDRNIIRSELNIPANAFVIANVGRLEAVKGQHTLLNAFSKVDSSAHLVIAGGGSLEGELKQLASDLKISDRVHILGVRNDVENVLAAADCYALCSTGSEGSSRATLEAMACRLPCVTTTVGMLPDIVKPHETGLLFEHSDDAALTGHLSTLITDKDLRDKLAINAYNMIMKNHTEEAMLKSIVDSYAEALEG